MNKLTVIYSLSTAPHLARHPKTAFSMEKFEIYTAALSSLTRRRAENHTIMHTDTNGAQYLRRTGLDCLWNEVKTTLPDDLNGINPMMFWAAGKLFALNATPAPVLMLDTDFIAWTLPALNAQVVCAHREPLNPATYPPVSRFNMRKGYQFPDFDYSLEPLNTAFIYMNNDDFKQKYVHIAFEFMRAAIDGEDYLTYMVFAEQRLLPMLAKAHGISVGTLMEYGGLHNQERYTHTWGAKQVMRDNPAEYERFCEKCKARLCADYPEFVHIIDLIERTDTT
jgi:hypothetical protein